jgi:hypothetical protein
MSTPPDRDPPDRDPPAALEAHLASYSEKQGLRERLQWLEDAAALTEAEARTLGEPAARAALDLRAALGAVVGFAQKGAPAEERLALEAVVRALTRRALHTLYAALTQSYARLGKEPGPYRAEARALAEGYAELTEAIQLGREPKAKTLERLARLAQRRPR